jgi:molybdenum cofactor synthesis domain-containing protein
MGVTRTAVVITVSDRSASGARADASGPAVAELLVAEGFEVPAPIVVADELDEISATLKDALSQGVDLILTTGGTGLGPRDVTPEATAAVVERAAPGLVELMRAEGLRHTPLAALSRATAGVTGRTLIVNLPGSPKGATESLEALLPVLPHALSVLAGDDAH